MTVQVLKKQNSSLTVEPYQFQNIYVITTYRCNHQCSFCLFRFNKEKEADIYKIIQRLDYSIRDSSQKVYIKITGGEPFLKLELLQKIFKLAACYSDKVYKIGIGTNGSIQMPQWFADVKTRTHIFLSRHNTASAPTPLELSKGWDNSLVDFRINCNLIKGQIDSVEKIEDFIVEMIDRTGITNFCFRELSKVDVDRNSMYPPQIYEYVDYYDKYLISMKGIEKQLRKHDNFQFSRSVGNYYDINHWYWYNVNGQMISVKFRSIDESRLIEFNSKTTEIDEYVIHPDSTLSGCWDRDMKVILKGDSDAE